ncbi:MAG: DUF2513 domain-containing protein [Oscillospiraceae bacterium]
MVILKEKLPQYEKETLCYTVLQLNDGGYLDVETLPVRLSTMPGIKSIKDMTFSGHEFINTIRSDDNWGQIKDTAKKAGIFSLQSIIDIGKAVAAAAITAALR